MAQEQGTGLPIPDFEHLPIGTLQHRIRSLSQEQMRTLIDHEEAHAHRTHVLEILRRRLGDLEEGAQPSSGSQEQQPEAAPPPAGGSAVTESGAAPSSNPPPHGVPAQPARPKGDKRV